MSQTEPKMNWYPGHMAKAKRLLSEQIRKSDLILEICDARVPLSSRNPDLITMMGGRRHLLVMNKTDLADPAVTEQWRRYFRNQKIPVFLSNAKSLKGKALLSAIEEQTRDTVRRAAEKGIRKTIRTIVVGVPNVGKSTIINSLRGGKVLETGDRPGVTQALRWVKISPYLDLMDSPGLLWPRLEDQEAARRLSYIGTLKDDVVDLYALTISLLEELLRVKPEETAARFHLSSKGGMGLPLMEDACRGRGWLLKQGEPDYDRCCRIVLDEFRAGKIGPVSLESPVWKTSEREEEQHD